ncbi:hypothetical protein [Planococcus shenhongbingii]|uniref:Type 4 fimbrial biogenesis protein PilX N-terminal domain-containing protein n=1 Tax=Planococcus shenhongbingii TaxID=3058398 RepID=A0ABT8NDH0_9BACL|nr:hypothetical protein [Planococcus sp. N017]MDN7245937.1 hypothetical protein [Planococcus sp. N017]
MMNKLKEESGYTLIIALLLIVLFLGMSAVFIQASLSHAKQEQTVDQGNLAVTAAEMGVEKYSKEAEKAFARTYALINAEAQVRKALLEAQVKKYPAHIVLNANCTKAIYPVMQEWINCNITEYDKELRGKFLNEMKNQLAISNMAEEQVSDTLSHKLSSISLQPVLAANNTVELELKVEGKKAMVNQGSLTNPSEVKIKSLSTKLKFPEVPFFDQSAASEIEVKWGQPLTDVTNFFPQLAGKPLSKCPEVSGIAKNMPPCEFVGKITSTYLEALKKAGVDSSFYIKVNDFPTNMNNFNAYGIPIFSAGGTITTNPNINSMDNLTIYYKGVLDFQNTNKLTNKNFIVAEIITFGNNQNIVGDNTLINIGNTAKDQFDAKMVTINSGSKLCINMDGVSLPTTKANLFTNIDQSDSNGQSGSDLAVKGSGKIHLYSNTAIPTVDSTKVKVVYFNDATKFLESCGVSINYNVEGVEKFGLPLLISDLKWNLDMEVDYQQ